MDEYAAEGDDAVLGVLVVGERIADELVPTSEPPPGVGSTSSTVADPASAGVPTTVPSPGPFTASVSCPAPGGGYTIDGRAAAVLDRRIRVSATVDETPRYLASFRRSNLQSRSLR